MVDILPKKGNRPLGEDANSVVGGESGNNRDQRKVAQDQGVGTTRSSAQSSSLLNKTPRMGSRQHQAIDDAQESLNSLLKFPADSGQQSVLSPSGVQRNSRGRIAGPVSSSRGRGAQSISANRNYQGSQSNKSQLIDATLSDGKASDPLDNLLAIIPDKQNQALYADERVHDMRAVSSTRLSLSLQIAGEKMQSARERIGLLVKADNNSDFGLDSALTRDLSQVQSSRRHAARWVTRYATHLVVLIVVGALGAFGGLRALTVQSAFPDGLQAVDAVDTYGTDYFLDESADQATFGNVDYGLTLPRTELGDSDAASNSRVYVAPVEGNDGLVGVRPSVRTAVTAYEVQAGDSIESIAAKFDVLPETVMGSNGIWDIEKELAAGLVLHIPPIDGIYYVAQEGDTVEYVARKFQADPQALKSYVVNNVSGDVLSAGQAIIVPGGMIPMREAAIDHVTQKGDTLKKIAARFGVDVPTLMHANSIPNPAELAPGTVLRVLPVSGMEYRTQTGDTVFSVANKFGVSTQTILDFSPNALSAEGTLPVDKLIMVPGGRPPSEVAAARLAAAKEAEQSEQAAKRESTQAESSSKSSTQSAIKPSEPKAPPVQAKPTAKPAAAASYSGGTGSLGWPLRSFRITQYYSGSHNGLDLAAPAGNNIYAAGSGTVIWAGWRTDGLGYCVFIDHGNGLTTVYGHMIRQPSVYVGEYVSRGEIIGYVGSTGRSTGPHTHFMVKVGASRNYRNPLTYLGSR